MNRLRSLPIRFFVALSAFMIIGCGTATSLKPTTTLIAKAQRAFGQAEKDQVVRYAPDEFLAAKSSLAAARQAQRESQQSGDLSFKRRRAQSARASAYQAWYLAEIASAIARRARSEEMITKLNSDIERYNAQAERYRAEERAAKEQRAKELAEVARTEALAKARAEKQAKQRALRAKAEAELLAAFEAAEKERALQRKRELEAATRQLEADKQRLEAKLTDAMKEIAKVREEKRGLIISLSDILFDFGKATLLPGANDKIGQLAGILSAYPDRQIIVEGHTDNVGSDSFNMQLSEARAESVRSALIANGIDPAMISSMGFGKTKPVASNAVAEGRQQNRRVEIVVLNPEPAAESHDAEETTAPGPEMAAPPAASTLPPAPGGPPPATP